MFPKNLGIPRCFLDADGVLANFDKLAHEILGMPSQEFEDTYGAKQFWRELNDYRSPEGLGFFEALDPMPDAMELFNAVKHLTPIILTGAPFGDWAREQKLRWGQKHFPGTEMIVCASKDKIKHIESPGDVLVDDTLKYRHLWEEGGGLFVHHANARDTLTVLRELVPIWFQRTDRWTPPKVA